MDKRPSWDEYFMAIARQVSTRATCLRRQIGAVLVLEKRLLCTGYNGPPSGLPHCEQVGCLREQMGIPSGERHELCRGLHAEMNAFLQAARYGIRIEGATLYCTHHPCILCSKMLINAGVRRVVICDDYPDALSKEMLAAGGVTVELTPASDAP
jgi:dCMP deaminase